MRGREIDKVKNLFPFHDLPISRAPGNKALSYDAITATKWGIPAMSNFVNVDGLPHELEGAPKTLVSRRDVLTQSAAVLATGAVLASGATSAVAKSTDKTPAGTSRYFQAYVRLGTSGSLHKLKAHPLGPREVLLRNEASHLCYASSNDILGSRNFTEATIPGHGGVGVVEQIGTMVKRVQVGDRVVVTGPQCGECYNCLQGRADRCSMGGGAERPHPIAEMEDGTPVVASFLKGGFAEVIITNEEFCVPVFTQVSPAELAVLHDVGVVGLATTMTVSPVEVGSDVVILGAGPLGLSAVQGARIKGAAQIIVVEPIKYRRELALKMGASIALDPNVEGAGLVEKIRQLCAGKSDRKLAGGGKSGADFVIEAVGGDHRPPKAGAGPDPTGILPLQQAWQMCSAAGHLFTTGVGHPADSVVSFPATQWTISSKTHHSGNFAGANVKRDVPRYVRLIEAGLFDAKSLVGTTYSLEQIHDAAQAAADRTTITALFVFS